MTGFTGGTFDRADRLRHDADALATLRADPAARRLVLDAALVPAVADGALVWEPMAGAAGYPVLLGLDEGAPRFAMLSDAATDVTTPMRSPAMMAALAALPPGEAATYAAARSVLAWHGRHRFCANCGHATAVARAGWERRCQTCRAEHFPRTDPVVIMIVEHAGRALLGRGKGWPEGRYSALAGFLEPGESIEEAVAREVWEETGVRVGAVRYVASQPWPFPSQLMIGCIALATGDALSVDHGELDDAMWVARDEVARVLAGAAGVFVAPPAFAIAHTLLTEWVGVCRSPSAFALRSG